jgi:hypothetical protein
MSTLLAELCTALAEAGIWLQLKDEGATLVAGPTPLVKQHPALVIAIKANKPALIAYLQVLEVHDLFCTQARDPRFATAACPDCGQQVPVVPRPRRLAAHTTPKKQAVCPGGERAQHIVADEVMQAFYTDRCTTERRQAVVTWTSLRGALAAWCIERDILLPLPVYLHAWLDERHTRSDGTREPAWHGLQLILQEWFGEDDEKRLNPFMGREDEEAPVQPTLFQGSKTVKLRA